VADFVELAGQPRRRLIEMARAEGVDLAARALTGAVTDDRLRLLILWERAGRTE
jgi:hypothetical protein